MGLCQVKCSLIVSGTPGTTEITFTVKRKFPLKTKVYYYTMQ